MVVVVVGEAMLIIVVEMMMMMIVLEGIGTCDVVVVVVDTMMTDGQPIAGMTIIIGGMITMIVVDMTIIDGDSEWERKDHQETILTSLAVLGVEEEIPN
jgi:hypothetical protein